MLAVRTPGAPQATRSVARPAIPPSPLRDRVGYSDHVRFRGYFPVHFIPAYNLPVYASRWPLPDTTQDSVRGCSLGFTAAAISGDGDQRTCKAQPSANRSARTFQGPAVPDGYRPRGAAVAARTPHPELDRHHAPPPHRHPRQNAAAMPMLRSADRQTITAEKFVMQ